MNECQFDANELARLGHLGCTLERKEDGSLVISYPRETAEKTEDFDQAVAILTRLWKDDQAFHAYITLSEDETSFLDYLVRDAK